MRKVNGWALVLCVFILVNSVGVVSAKNFNITGNGRDIFFVNGNSRYVGIGTGSPSLKLDVASSDLNPPATTGTTNTGFMRIGYDRRTWAGAELNIGVRNDNNYPVWFQAQNPADLSVNRNIVFNPNGGNVGIGTTSPDFKLQVDGDIAPETNATFDLGTSVLAWDNVYAVTYNDLTPAWVKGTDGSAKNAIAKISNNGKEINHTSYPIKLRSKFYTFEFEETKTRQIEKGFNITTNETIYENEPYNEIIKKSIKVDESLSQLEQENYIKKELNISDITETEIQFTRDIGGTVTLIIEAIKELFDWNDKQDDRIELLEEAICIEATDSSKYAWCSAIKHKQV